MILQSDSITKNKSACKETREGKEQRKQDFMNCEDQIAFLDFSFFPIEDDLFNDKKVVEVLLDSVGRDEVDTKLQNQRSSQLEQEVVGVFLDNAGRDEVDTQLQGQRSSQLELDNYSYSLGNSTSFLYSLKHPGDPSSSSSLPRNDTGLEPSLLSLLIEDKLPEDNQVNRFKPHHKQKWIRRFKEFLEFVRENGHGAVPHTYPKNQQLARWVNRQRRQCKLFQDGRPSSITEDRLEMLASAGFIWDAHEAMWREKLEFLREFHQKNGHCVVPTKYKEQGLGMWVKCQRRQYKLYLEGKPSSMNSQRIAELERLSFDWEVRKDPSKDSNCGNNHFPFL